jgi:hypothetical protein
MIPMNHEERNPMKKLLIYFGYALAVAALLTLFAHMIAASLYTLALIAIVLCVAYFHQRTNE